MFRLVSFDISCGVSSKIRVFVFRDYILYDGFYSFDGLGMFFVEIFKGWLEVFIIKSVEIGF